MTTDILILPFETDSEPLDTMLSPAVPEPLPELFILPSWAPPLAKWEDGSTIDGTARTIILADIGYYQCRANEQAWVLTLPDGVIY